MKMKIFMSDLLLQLARDECTRTFVSRKVKPEQNIKICIDAICVFFNLTLRDTFIETFNKNLCKKVIYEL